MRRLLLILILLAVALPAVALEIPAPSGYVNDFAGILTAQTRQGLERYLREFERSDSTQIVVATLPSLEGESLEDVSLRIAETWKIGQQGKDNGALLLIIRDERKLRIEVGYGLEGRVTDLLTGRIVDNEIRPRFRQGDYDGGVIAGVKALVEAARGEYQGSGSTSRRKERGAWWILPLLFFVLPLVMRIASPASGVGRHHRSGGFWIGGGGFGGGGFGGGGGFSGGGGGFGGGGSSGSW